MTTFDAVLTRVLKDDPGRPLGDVLRRRHRRAGGAVPDHLRELGGQGGVAARRRARSDPRRHAADRPAPALAGPGLPRRRLDRRPGGLRRRRPGRRGVRPRLRGGWAERAADIPVLACSLLPLGVRFADPLPDGVHDVGVEVWSQPDAFVPYDPPIDTDPAYDLGASSARTPSCGARPPPVIWSPTAAASCRWRTRLPHRVSPPSRSRSHGAAPWSWSLRPTGSGSRRRTSPSAPPLASLPERPGVG